MKAAQVDLVERTTELLTRFNLSTAALELGQRLENAGQREALLLVVEVLEMEAEAREQRKIARPRRPTSTRQELRDARCEHAARPADAKAVGVGARRVPGAGRERACFRSAGSGQEPRRLRDRQRADRAGPLGTVSSRLPVSAGAARGQARSGPAAEVAPARFVRAFDPG